MDVIAGRKTVGEITGEILVDGYPKDQKTWARVVGYVEQFDIHTASALLLFNMRHTFFDTFGFGHCFLTSGCVGYEMLLKTHS